MVTTRSAAAVTRPLEPVALGPEHQRQPLRRRGGQGVETDGVGGERERRHREAVRAQHVDALRPWVDPRPRHLEDGAHRHPDAPPVEGVGALRGHQHGVHPERGGAAEAGTEVGVVHDAVEDRDPARACTVPRAAQHRVHGRHRRSVHRRQRAAVQVETRDRLDDLRRPDVHGYVPVLPCDLSEQIGQLGQPPLGHQERPRPMTRLERADDHLAGLGHVQPAGRLQAPAQRDVGQVQVVGEAFVVGVGHAQHGHAAILP